MMKICLQLILLLLGFVFANDTVSFFFDFSRTELDESRTMFVSEDFAGWNDKGKQGKINLNYCAKSDFSKAYAEIADAPLLNGQRALHYVVHEPNNLDSLSRPLKGRVQNEFNVKKGFRSFVNEVDVLFPQSMNKIKEFDDAMSFFSLQEYWNDTHGKESSFKITLRISKAKGLGQDLFLLLTADDNYKIGRHRVASFRDSSWAIPFGEWFSIRTEIVEGTGDLGWVRVSVKKKHDELWNVVFDEDIQTKSSAYIGTGKESKGFRSLQSLKFYMTKVLVEFFKKENVPLEVYYTNWKFIGLR